VLPALLKVHSTVSLPVPAMPMLASQLLSVHQVSMAVLKVYSMVYLAVMAASEQQVAAWVYRVRW
jgi:hypothetical protein